MGISKAKLQSISGSQKRKYFWGTRKARYFCQVRGLSTSFFPCNPQRFAEMIRSYMLLSIKIWTPWSSFSATKKSKLLQRKWTMTITNSWRRRRSGWKRRRSWMIRRPKSNRWWMTWRPWKRGGVLYRVASQPSCLLFSLWCTSVYQSSSIMSRKWTSSTRP